MCRCGRKRPRGGLVFFYHGPWGRLAEEDKVQDGLAVRCKYSWLVSPLSTLNLPNVLWFFAGWHDVFWPHNQQSLYCNKRVKWAEPQRALGEPSVWPNGLPAAHMLPPCIVLWSRHMLPVRCPFCSDNSSKGVKETRFLLVSVNFLAQYGNGYLLLLRQDLLFALITGP